MPRQKHSRKPNGKRPPRILLALRKRARRRTMLHKVALTTKAAFRLKDLNTQWAAEKHT